VKTWQKILISTLVTLAIGGIYLLSVWKHRRDPGVIGRQEASQQVNMDDVAVVRSLSAAHFEDTLALQGTSVWMKNGYAIPYFPYAGGQVQFAGRVGLIPALQRLDVKKVVKATAPANVYDGMGHGSRQAFAVFTLPGGKELFATPIGAMDGSDENYYCDLLFFYDDPHGIYNDWPKDVWAAIDAHQAKVGMSELQTRLAIGQNRHTTSREEGDRTVTYDQNGKHWTIVYVKDKATAIKTQ